MLVSLLDGKYEVKIADFGLSRAIHENKADSSVVPIRWFVHLVPNNDICRSAPEVLQGNASTSKSDVFSFAVVLHEVQLCENGVVMSFRY